MKISDNIIQLATALAKAQGEIEDAIKDRENPHFKTQYADLSSVRDAVRQPLSRNGLAYVQLVRTGAGGVEVETILMHVSGQYISEVLTMPLLQNSAQAIGGAISYGRRYSLMAIVGLAASAEDDDANAASRTAGPSRQAPPRAAEPPRRTPPPQADQQSGVRPTPSIGGEAENSAGGTTHTTAETTPPRKSIIDPNDPLIVDLKAHLETWDSLRTWHNANKDKVVAKGEEWKNEFYTRYDDHAARLKAKAGLTS